MILRSVWRVPEFASFNPPTNWNDNEIWCGAAHQTDIPGTNCGVCGDSLNQPAPRPNEMRGSMYRGIITGRYTAGQVIDIEVDLTQSHMGFMEFRLCANPGNGAGENQACFNQHLLQRADGGGSRIQVRTISHLTATASKHIPLYISGYRYRMVPSTIPSTSWCTMRSLRNSMELQSR